jgi:hypothetical protein
MPHRRTATPATPAAAPAADPPESWGDADPLQRAIALRRAGRSTPAEPLQRTPAGGAGGADGADAFDEAEVDRLLAGYPVVSGPGGPREWRLRHQLVPFGVIGLLWAGGVAAAATPGGWMVAAAALVFAVVWWCAWERRRRPGRVERRRWATRVVIGGSGWLLVAATCGAGGPVAAALWLGGYAAAWPHWRAHRIPIPAEPVDEPAPALEVLQAAPEIPRRWADRVAVARGVLPESYLTDHQLVGRTEQWTIQLDPVTQTSSSAVAAQLRVGAALGRSMDAVTIDRHPSGDLSRALLIIADNNPLHRDVVLPDRDLDRLWDPSTGYAVHGLHADGGPAHWAFTVPNWGLAGGFLIGSIGSGKSAAMTVLALLAMHTRHLVVWGADPTGGGAIPTILRHADWPATTMPEIRLQLRALRRAIDVRSALNALRGVDKHVCTPAEPGILLFADEFHRLTEGGRRAEETKILTLVAREGRKYGVNVIGADQYPGLKSFGDEEPMRLNMFARNIAVFRSPSNVSKGLIPGLDISPADIPAYFPTGKPTSGLGYMVGERTAPYRGWFSERVGEQLAAAPRATLDKVVAAGIGADYLDRHARSVANRAEKAAALADLDLDVLAPILEADPALAAALRAYRIGSRPVRAINPLQTAIPLDPAGPSERPARPGAGPGPVLRLVPAPRLQLPGQSPGSAVPAADRPAGEGPLATPAGRRLYELIRAGVTRTGELERQSGYGETHTRNNLAALADAGLIHRIRHGTWEVTDAA